MATDDKRFYLKTTYKEDEDGDEVWFSSSIHCTTPLDAPKRSTGASSSVDKDSPLIAAKLNSEGLIDVSMTSVSLNGNDLFVVIEKLRQIEKIASNKEK